MSPSRARFVTGCQQLLALGVVVVALVPATRVVTLDVVGVRPDGMTGQPTIGRSGGGLVDPLGPQVTGHSIRVAERGGG